MAFKLPIWLITTVILSSLSAPILNNIVNNTNLINPTYHYFFKLPLLSLDNSQGGGSNNKQKLFDEDRKRIEGYYNKYFAYPTFINKITNSGDQNVEKDEFSFYIHIQKEKYERNIELEWLKTVRLNQITIDRYFEQDSSSESSLASFKELITTKNLFPKYSQIAQNALNQEAFDIFLRNVNIDHEDIKKLVYYPSENTGIKRWYVWLDKDLLRLKLNLKFLVWLFNTPFGKSNSSIQDLFKKELESTNQLHYQINSLFNELTEDEKDFFYHYYNKFWLTRSDSSNGKLNPQEITSEQINVMYNTFSLEGKNMSIFKNHLLQVVEGGNRLSFESFFPNYITYASGPDALHTLKANNEYQSNVKVTITPDKWINNNWRVREILDLFKNYSVAHFTLKTTNGNDNKNDQWPLILFTNEKESIPIIEGKYFYQKKLV